MKFQFWPAIETSVYKSLFFYSTHKSGQNRRGWFSPKQNGSLILKSLILSICFVFSPVSAYAKIPVARFALFVGANDGGPGRVMLRYAMSDAQAMAQVLEQLGGISSARRVSLFGPNRTSFLAGLEQLKAKIEKQRGEAERIELLIYYSGHSDESGLILGSERLNYSELRAEVNRLPADVRIVVLDSCSSGALIRTKGGKRVAPFLVGDSAAVRGHAFLTASSADEAAQESDRIGASYFTAALLTGLRGAADASGDGRVTLHEAYQYAFNETLARTERSSAGPQHPAYDIQLVGTGDLVLTDLRGSSAGLVIGPQLEGRLYLRDRAGHLVAELKKAGGSLLELGFEPGEYNVTLETAGTWVYEAKVKLIEGKKAELHRENLRSVTKEAVTLRGDPIDASTRVDEVYPFSIGIFPPLQFPLKDGLNNFAMSLLMTRSSSLNGLQLSMGFNYVANEASGIQIGTANWVQGSLTGLQLSLASNWVGKDSSSARQVGTVNIAAGALRGMQLGLAANITGGDCSGLQIGTVNVANGNFRGLQASLAVNTAAGDANGLQLGTVNVVDGNFRGAQISMGVNVANEVNGLQLGIVNVAKQSDYPIGILNFISDGYKAVTIWGSDISIGNIAVKLGGKRLYSLLGIAAHPNSREHRYSAMYGFGTHVSGEKLFLDIDLLWSTFFNDDLKDHVNVSLVSLRLNGGLRLFKSFSIVAGPALHMSVGEEGHDLRLGLGGGRKVEDEEIPRGTTVRVFPGFSIGFQI